MTVEGIFIWQLLKRKGGGKQVGDGNSLFCLLRNKWGEPINGNQFRKRGRKREETARHLIVKSPEPARGLGKSAEVERGGVNPLLNASGTVWPAGRWGRKDLSG